MFFYRLLCDFSVLKFSMAYLLVITIPKITEMGQLLLKYSVVQMVAGTLFYENSQATHVNVGDYL